MPDGPHSDYQRQRSNAWTQATELLAGSAIRHSLQRSPNRVSFNDRVGHDDRPGVDRCLSVHGPREDFRSSPSSIEMSLRSKICVAVISMLLECKPLRVA